MPKVYHASPEDSMRSIEFDGLKPAPGRLGTYVYCTFTKGQAERIGRNRWNHDFVIYEIDVFQSEIRKVEEHPAWCGMAAFKEVCLDGVDRHRLTLVHGGGPRCAFNHVVRSRFWEGGRSSWTQNSRNFYLDAGNAGIRRWGTEDHVSINLSPFQREERWKELKKKPLDCKLLYIHHYVMRMATNYNMGSSTVVTVLPCLIFRTALKRHHFTLTHQPPLVPGRFFDWWSFHGSIGWASRGTENSDR